MSKESARPLHLAPLDFDISLDKLDSLTSEQLALVQYHAECTETARVQAELIFWRRRERDLILGVEDPDINGHVGGGPQLSEDQPGQSTLEQGAVEEADILDDVYLDELIGSMLDESPREASDGSAYAEQEEELARQAMNTNPVGDDISTPANQLEEGEVDESVDTVPSNNVLDATTQQSEKEGNSSEHTVQQTYTTTATGHIQEPIDPAKSNQSNVPLPSTQPAADPHIEDTAAASTLTTKSGIEQADTVRSLSPSVVVKAEPIDEEFDTLVRAKSPLTISGKGEGAEPPVTTARGLATPSVASTSALPTDSRALHKPEGVKSQPVGVSVKPADTAGLSEKARGKQREQGLRSQEDERKGGRPAAGTSGKAVHRKRKRSYSRSSSSDSRSRSPRRRSRRRSRSRHRSPPTRRKRADSRSRKRSWRSSYSSYSSYTSSSSYSSRSSSYYSYSSNSRSRSRSRSRSGDGRARRPPPARNIARRTTRTPSEEMSRQEMAHIHRGAPSNPDEKKIRPTRAVQSRSPPRPVSNNLSFPGEETEPKAPSGPMGPISTRGRQERARSEAAQATKQNLGDRNGQYPQQNGQQAWTNGYSTGPTSSSDRAPYARSKVPAPSGIYEPRYQQQAYQYR